MSDSDNELRIAILTQVLKFKCHPLDVEFQSCGHFVSNDPYGPNIVNNTNSPKFK